jgi:hypothetical protein
MSQGIMLVTRELDIPIINRVRPTARFAAGVDQ